MKRIGWGAETNLLDIQSIFCGKGYSGLLEGTHPGSGLALASPTQVCFGDSGGPIFTEINTVEVEDEHLLYQFSNKVQLGVTVWVDAECDKNFNGFVEIEPYLGWMEEVLPNRIFKRIDERIIPSKKQVDTFHKYKSIVLEWRAKQN